MNTLEDRHAPPPLPADSPRQLRPPRVYHVADTQPIPMVRQLVITPAAAPPPRRSLVGWGVAGVCALIAAAFGFMWSSTRERGNDDVNAQRVELAAENARLKGQLATVQGELSNVQDELATAQGELATVTDKLGAADLRVAELLGELESARNAPTPIGSAVDFAPKSSLALGQSLGESAFPALSADEARCVGGATIDTVGVDFLLLEYLAYDYPTDAQYDRLVSAGYDAAETCGVPAYRLGL